MRVEAEAHGVMGKCFWKSNGWGFTTESWDLNPKEKEKQIISNAEDECIIK